MVLDDYLEQGIPLQPLLKILGLPRSSYYYQPTGTKAGKRKAKVFYKDGIPVSKDVLITDIKELLSQEFVDYGYFKTYVHLKNELGYAIGSTRTYQIMKENKLLKFQRNKQKRKNRNWVKDLVPKVEHPFNFLEFDIKFAYIQGTRTNVMVLTVLDVFSRWNLGHYIANSIKKEDVINLFEQISSEHQMPERFIVRNDNGSQFVASQVQEYFVENNIIQEFTKPSTPQQNAHIESYHSIMESAICQRFEFKDLDDFNKTMDRFRKFYNFDRIHGGLEFTSPANFLKKHGVDMEREAA
jgi:transposase InsO family protein